MRPSDSTRVATTKEELASEAQRATRMLQGKVVRAVWRHRPEEIGIEFEDGARLFVDMRPTGLEISITGLPEDEKPA